MEQFLSVVQWVVANYEALIAALAGVFLAIDAVLVVIPGKDPVVFKQVGEFLKKLSYKSPSK